jgi:hypothetical protein
MPDNEPATRRELDQRFAALEKHIDLRFDSRDVALELQAAEYGRRLGELNHAHQQALEAQARTVPRETYEEFLREFREWKELITETLNTEREQRRLELQPWRDRQQYNAGVKAVIATLAAAAFAVGAALATVLGRVVF